MSNITVIDSCCGAGKTQMMIKMINDNQSNNYLYITPFLDEVERIKKCTEYGNNVTRFKEPVNTGKGKMSSLINLLTDSCDVASTHMLFHNCSEDIIDLIRAGHYTLILDEVMDVVEIMRIKKSDLADLLTHAQVNDSTGKLEWTDDDYYGDNFPNIYRMCKAGHIYLVNGIAIVWTFPVEIFEAFEHIYICTYMFDAQIQKYYYDAYNVEYAKLSVKDGSLIPYTISKPDLSKLHILTKSKLNIVGNDKYSLSKSWYSNKKCYTDILRKNMVNYTKNIASKYLGRSTKSSDIIWTTFKDSVELVKGKGYTKSFIPCNSRSTNAYSDRTIIMYSINIYVNPLLMKFFHNFDIHVDEDTYALSEMIQFIYRSAIRNDKDVYCYIPSKRMRELLLNFINSEEE